MSLVSRSSINAAMDIIQPLIHKTPVMSSRSLNQLFGCELYFKCEHLQRTGSFKFRGASHAVQTLPAETQAVATHSSGNHGAALAKAAADRDIRATIVVPENANTNKVAAIRHYGGEVVFCHNSIEAREAMLETVVKRDGAEFVPPYDDLRVIAGQGTIALELMEQVPDLEAIIAPVGGGGMLAGISTCYGEESSPESCKVFGAEPELADDARRSFKSGSRVTSQTTTTIADGLRTTLGAHNFELIQAHVADILCVTEAEIVDSMALIWTRLKQVAEPSAAVTLAVIKRYQSRFAGKRVGLILSGGNIDPAQLPF